LRASNRAQRRGITTVGQLCALTDEDVLEWGREKRKTLTHRDAAPLRVFGDLAPLLRGEVAERNLPTGRRNSEASEGGFSSLTCLAVT